MGNLLIDLLIAIPIGIMYNMTIHKTGEIFNYDIDYNYKVQRNLLISFGGGIIGLMMAMFVFGQNSRFKNRSIRYGLYFGSILLLIHTIMYNWETLENDSKFVIMIITLLALMLYVYNNFTENEENKEYKEKSNRRKNVSFADDNDDTGSKYLPATYINYEPYGNFDEQHIDDGIMYY
jgi:hypothetical protein